jgi:hypothetical protein
LMLNWTLAKLLLDDTCEVRLAPVHEP